jgi:hypothetical protein
MSVIAQNRLMNAIILNRLLILFASVGMVISALLWISHSADFRAALHGRRLRRGGALALLANRGHPRRRVGIRILRAAGCCSRSRACSIPNSGAPTARCWLRSARWGCWRSRTLPMCNFSC